jgi:hypothetical protein
MGCKTSYDFALIVYRRVPKSPDKSGISQAQQGDSAKKEENKYSHPLTAFCHRMNIILWIAVYIVGAFARAD